jgi:hypothetical protein
VSEPTPDTVVCEACHTSNPRRAFRCAKCGGLLPAGRVTTQPPAAPRPAMAAVEDFESNAKHGSQFSLASLFSVISLIAIFLAIFRRAPGIGITLCLASFPAFVRTALLARRREQIDRPLSTSDKIASFIGSLGVVLASATMLAVVAGVTFFFVCIGTISFGPGGTRNDPEGYIALVVFLGCVVAVLPLALILFWVRARWRRDTRDTGFRRRRGP